jgi:S-adenosylmethionine-diacylglycerol 3-amino-3-carboxypropyl transferase
MAYFSHLNYTLANEDTALELEVLPRGVDHVLAVAGSGARVLPLLARAPAQLTCVDVVDAQLWLTELRVEAARALSHAEYLAFWGYPPAPAPPDVRRALFERIALSAPAEAFFRAAFAAHGWESLLYTGRWERTFARLARVNGALTGRRGKGLFEHASLDAQRAYVERDFPRHAWRIVLALLGNATVFNALLYNGHFPRKNLPGSLLAFYEGVFSRLFVQGLARENFFLQLAFFGRIVYAEGNPVECDPHVYAQIQRGLETARVAYRQGDLLDVSTSDGPPIDFLSLSDVPSYFEGETERRFLQRLRPSLRPGGMAVLRSYLRVPQGLNTDGFDDVTEQFQDVVAREKVGVYHVGVYQKRGEI